MNESSAHVIDHVTGTVFGFRLADVILIGKKIPGKRQPVCHVKYPDVVFGYLDKIEDGLAHVVVGLVGTELERVVEGL